MLFGYTIHTEVEVNLQATKRQQTSVMGVIFDEKLNSKTHPKCKNNSLHNSIQNRGVHNYNKGASTDLICTLYEACVHPNIELFCPVLNIKHT